MSPTRASSPPRADCCSAGGREGYFYALDAKTGALLWKTQLGGPVAAGPMSYSINGRQFIAVNAGTTMYVFAVKQ